MDWSTLADGKTIEKTAKALSERGIEVIIANNAEEARKKLIELIPKGSQVMNVTSMTLDQIGISKEIENGDYDSYRKKILAVNDEKERADLRRKLISPDYGIGSVQAVTEEGQVVMVSATGSQLPVYAYGAANVIWVVGVNKIVKNIDEAYKRIYEYVLPLESERINKVYNTKMGSHVNKILILEHERPGRIKMIIVKEKLGF